jgi:hypothetical protein
MGGEPLAHNSFQIGFHFEHTKTRNKTRILIWIEKLSLTLCAQFAEPYWACLCWWYLSLQILTLLTSKSLWMKAFCHGIVFGCPQKEQSWACKVNWFMLLVPRTADVLTAIRNGGQRSYVNFQLFLSFEFHLRIVFSVENVFLSVVLKLLILNLANFLFCFLLF